MFRWLHVSLFLIEGDPLYVFHFFFLEDFSLYILLLKSIALSSYWSRFTLFLSKRSFITCFFLLRFLFLCLFTDLFLDQLDPVLSHWFILGIHLQLPDHLLGCLLQNIIFFIYFIMFEEGVHMNKVLAEWKRNLPRNAMLSRK